MKWFLRAAAAAMFTTAVFLSLTCVQAVASERAQAASVQSAERSTVCMVTNMVPGDRKMIPVEFEGRTYYGCCPVCVKRLKTERAVRYGVDPVSGREVDKSTAFIVAGPDRKAIYFESAETAGKFRALSSTQKIRQ